MASPQEHRNSFCQVCGLAPCGLELRLWELQPVFPHRSVNLPKLNLIETCRNPRRSILVSALIHQTACSQFLKQVQIYPSNRPNSSQPASQQREPRPLERPAVGSVNDKVWGPDYPRCRSDLSNKLDAAITRRSTVVGCFMSLS